MGQLPEGVADARTPALVGGDGDVTVLLVDDDELWARSTGRALEQTDPVFEVRTRHSATAALDAFDPETVDCVVSDYQMPEVSGLELLATIRADHPDLPFLLITGRGNESVASEAISEQVTDYISKTGTADATTVIATRIRHAVESYRVEQRLAAVHRDVEALHDVAVDLELCETRDAVYERTVTAARRVLDAACCDVLVERDGTITGVARAGTRHSTATLTALIQRVVRPCLDASSPRLERAWGGRSGPESVLVVPVGSAGVLVATAPQANRFDAYDLDVAEILASHVTAALDRLRSRERIERERDSKEAMRALLTSTATRSAIERAVCERLVEVEGYRLAWVGEYAPTAGVSVRDAAGATDYLSAVSLDAPPGDRPAEPSVRAVDSETTTARTVEEAADAEWARAAWDRDFHHVVAEPLVSRDVLHGVLVAYAADQLDDARRRLLGEYAASLATAVADAKRDQSLGAETATELALQVRDDSAPLVALSRALAERGASGQVTVRGAVPVDDAISYYVDCHDADPDVVQTVSTWPDGPETASVTAVDADAATVELDVERPTVLSLLFDHGGVLQAAEVADGTATVTAEFGRHVDVRAVAEAIREEFGQVTVASLGDVEREAEDWTRAVSEDLTAKQLEAVKTAYFSGYFERPRERDASAVADALDLSRQAFLQHLRVAQRKTFAELFEHN